MSLNFRHHNPLVGSEFGEEQHESMDPACLVSPVLVFWFGGCVCIPSGPQCPHLLLDASIIFRWFLEHYCTPTASTVATSQSNRAPLRRAATGDSHRRRADCDSGECFQHLDEGMAWRTKAGLKVKVQHVTSKVELTQWPVSGQLLAQSNQIPFSLYLHCWVWTYSDWNRLLFTCNPFKFRHIHTRNTKVQEPFLFTRIIPENKMMKLRGILI